MSIGLILLGIVSALVLFGVAQRVLDKMQLSDRAALIIAAAIFFGGLIPDIRVGRVAFNLGGVVIPLGVCAWLLIKTDTKKEAVRALIGSVITAAAVFLLGKIMPDEPERIIIEYNSVWGIENLFRIKKPVEWELAQMVTLIDATTFDNYLTNMRNLMTEGPKLADLVIFNRCDENTKKSSYRRIIKGMNNTCNIIFENVDGTSDDGVGEEDLPYDMKADVIEIKDDQFGIWYIDCMEHPARYNERKIRIKGMGFRLENLPKKTYVFGRFAMTCCADDIGGIGFICRYKDKFPKEKEWFYLNAKIESAFSEIHGRAAVILVEESREPAEKPEEELVYFG